MTTGGPRRRHLGLPAAIAAAVLAGLAVAAAAAPLVAALLGHDPAGVDLLNRAAPPSPAHPLGTDELGRDLLVRLLYGGRVSLTVAVAAAAGAALIGTVIGLAAGYFAGRTDAALMRVTDAVIALPLLPLLIVLSAVDPAKVWGGLEGDPGGGLGRIILIVALVGWTTVARLVRAATLSVRQRDYVRAARALGTGHLAIMVRHILPNVASPVIVATTLAVGQVILLESVLSFLGVGIQPPAASWGNMLTNAQELIWTAPRLAVMPGALIFVTVIACNLLGDGLLNAYDPRLGGNARRPA